MGFPQLLGTDAASTISHATEPESPRIVTRNLVHLFAAVQCAALLAVAGEARAGLAQYPFRVVREPELDGQRLYAVNAGDAPVSVRVALTGQNLGVDGATATQRFVVPPRSTRAMGRVFAFDPRRPYTLDEGLQWRVGDERAQPDATALQLPFAEGVTATIAPRTRRHAVEFALEPGTAVLAGREGTVIDRDAQGVIVLHADGTYARYFRVLPATEPPLGTHVATGTPLGTAGADTVEIALQVTRADEGGPLPVALPFRLSAYAPRVPVELTPGRTIIADFTHPYTPEAEEPRAIVGLPALKSPAAIAHDLDRETVARAYEATTGRLPRVSAPLGAMPAASRWPRWRDLGPVAILAVVLLMAAASITVARRGKAASPAG